MAKRPWYPNEVVAEGRTLRTDALSTWYPEGSVDLTNWKSQRLYVDARDVSEESWPGHPGHAIPRTLKRLRQLLAVAPIFALGEGGEAKALRVAGARIYEVGFSRTGGDGLYVCAEGPDGPRTFSGSIHDLDFDVHRLDGIDRILRAVTDDRVTERSMDLAEMLGAMAGDDSYYVFLDHHREAFLASWDKSLRQVFARAKKHGRGAEIVATLRDAEEQGVEQMPELADIGPVRMFRLPELEVPQSATEERPYDGIRLDGFDDDVLVLREVLTWSLFNAPKDWLPPATKAWRDGAAERHRESQAAAADKKRQLDAAAAKRRRPFQLFGLLMLALGLGWCANQMRKATYDEPCQQNDECRSGICRLVEGAPGYCTTRCFPCREGTRCAVDPRFDKMICVREPRLGPGP